MNPEPGLPAEHHMAARLASWAVNSQSRPWQCVFALAELYRNINLIKAVSPLPAGFMHPDP